MVKKKMLVVVAMVIISMFSLMACSTPEATTSPEPEVVTEAADVEAGVEADVEEEATGSTSDSVEDKKVAMVLWGTMYDFFVYIGASANQTAADAGVQLDILTTNDLAEGADLATLAITQGYDAIIMMGYEAYRTSYEEAIAAGIPVVTFDSFLNDVDLFSRVGSDNYQLGVMAGEAAVDYLTEQGAEASGKVVVLNEPSTGTMNARSQGFKDTVAAAFADKEIEEITLTDAEATAEGSQGKVDNLLIANPSGTVDIIFGSNAGMSLGTIASVEVAGRTEVAVFGIDNEEGQLNALKDGAVYRASIGQDTVKIGQEAMLAAIKAIQGERAGDIVVEGTLITQDNVEEFLSTQAETYAALESFKP